jgi:hypothetical protein
VATVGHVARRPILCGGDLEGKTMIDEQTQQAVAVLGCLPGIASRLIEE